MNDIVKSSYVKIMPLTKSLECEWTNKSPFPTNTQGVDDIGRGGVIHVVWAMLPNVLEYLIKTHPSEFLPDSYTEYTSGDTRIYSQLHPPLLINFNAFLILSFS